jgi:DNA-binding NtrC family response regulator
MGAFAFTPQPIKLDELGSLVTRALEANRMDGRLADENSVG